MTRYNTTKDGDVPFTAAEEAAADISEAAAAAEVSLELSKLQSKSSKLAGILILGVMCSATKKDQSGMLAVGFNKLLADAAGQAFPSTKFEFENGNELVITADNYAAIQAIWVPFRQSFFTVS
jgi:hypothetical protein